ncbi:MAG: hypothetical protein G01um10148_622 [Parcubacteria group bacterium Gr01-1014_8]|nr:MAG: hypothetical protein G01um10148_622 [Parcubacteria group bacterium Gr01-1014_8]
MKLELVLAAGFLMFSNRHCKVLVTKKGAIRPNGTLLVQCVAMLDRRLIIGAIAGALCALVFLIFWQYSATLFDFSAASAVSNGMDREGWKTAKATVFWVGEGATEDNAFIHNSASAWDEDWEEHFGGVDDPEERCGYQPCAFTPKENPFYVALPYNDMRRDKRKNNSDMIPWNESSARTTLLKDRWIEVRLRGKSCFGQWEDVGPHETDDVDYVFGDAEWPANEQGEWAGIDLSPAMRDCLHAGDVSEVEWRHVANEAVSQGPWLDIVTER